MIALVEAAAALLAPKRAELLASKRAKLLAPAGVFKTGEKVDLLLALENFLEPSILLRVVRVGVLCGPSVRVVRVGVLCGPSVAARAALD